MVRKLRFSESDFNAHDKYEFSDKGKKIINIIKSYPNNSIIDSFVSLHNG